MTPTTPLLIERRPSLKEVAYRQIKDLLVSGEMSPDKLYSAQHFAALLGVSRTPVREALLQLTNEGFLVCLDVRGFKVREFTAKEIHDVMETRMVIECAVIERLANGLTPEDLRAMSQSLESMAACARAANGIGFLEADQEFHVVPIRRLGNQHLLSIMDNIRGCMSLFGLTGRPLQGRYDEVLREHGAILEALRRKDRAKSVRAVRHHLATTESCLVGRESRTPEG